MSILNEEELDMQRDRYVLVVSPKEEEFKSFFQKDYFSPLLIDPLHEVNMVEVARGVEAGYIDLSVVTSFKALTNVILPHPEGMIFDNIDRIPKSDDRDYICQTVLYALKKEEETPLNEDKWIDFSKFRVGARCKQYPAYLEHIYNYLFKIEIPNDANA